MSDLAKRRAYIEQLWIVSRHRAEWLRSTSAAPAPLNLEICCHDVVWAYDDDNLAETAKSIEASDTDCANYIIYDLDETHENGEFKSSRPILTVSGWAERKW